MRKAVVSLAIAASVGVGVTLSTVAGAQTPSGNVGRAARDPGSGRELKRLQHLEIEAKAALKAGDTKLATRLAKELLAGNTTRSSWNFGDIIYGANQILGLAALREGDVKGAKRYLLAAGGTPGSPVLNSFGPEMTLAQELMKKGEGEVVSEFLDLVRKFWAVPPANTPSKFVPQYTNHAATLNRWQEEIRSGKQPSLNRFDFTPSLNGGPAGVPDAAAAPERERPALLAPGTAAPDFSALTTSGRAIKLSDYRGKVVVLDFWASWCPPCVASMPHNQAITKKLQKEGVPVVLLALDNSEERAPFLAWTRKHPELNAITFAHAAPTTADIAGKKYGVSGIPTQYVIDPQGVIRASFVGFGGPTDDLEKAVRAAQKRAPAAAR